MVDYVHMLIQMLTKYAVSQAMGYVQGMSAIDFMRVYDESKLSSLTTTFGRGGILTQRWGEMSL